MKLNHFELVMCTATAPSTGAAAAALTGDSLVIKNGKGARLISAWADLQAAGAVQIIRGTESAHDTTRDIRCRVPASEVELLWPLGIAPAVKAQETLGVTIIGSATAGDVEQVGMLVGYEDLPGSNQRNIGYTELVRRMENVCTVEATITSEAGGYSLGELINAESDLLKSNRDYAVIGYRCSVECGCVWVKGPDTGNVRVGGPGNDLDGELTSGWFVHLARALDSAVIPVVNGGNKAQTYLGIAQDEVDTDVPLSLILGLLK